MNWKFVISVSREWKYIYLKKLIIYNCCNSLTLMDKHQLSKLKLSVYLVTKSKLTKIKNLKLRTKTTTNEIQNLGVKVQHF